MKLNRRRFIATSTGIATTVVAGCTGGGGGGGDSGSGGGGGGGGGTATVEMPGVEFDPVRLEVEPGTEVVWKNTGSISHMIKDEQFHDEASEWSFTSKNIGPDQTASHTFESEGIYEYYCLTHGQNQMCGVVLVGDVSLDKQLPCESGDSSY